MSEHDTAERTTSLRAGVLATPPVERDGLRVSAPAEAAAGLPALAATYRHLHDQTGVWRGARTLLDMNQRNGFDCPGCAWPDPVGERSVAEFCENGAKALAEEATTRRVDAAFFARHSVAELSRQSDYWLSQQGRLVEPMYLPAEGGHYRPIAWNEAFALIARHLHALSSPDRAAFYTSGRASNEAAFLYQLMVRRFGTNNFPDCSNMCHETSGVALKEVIGVGTGTVSLEDFEHAELIIVQGQNPGSNHPRMLAALQTAARRGARIVSINPLRETGLKRFRHPQEPHLILGPGTELAQSFLQVRIGGDVALLQGVMKGVLEYAGQHQGVGLDLAFIADRTRGYEALEAQLKAADWGELERGSGISEAQMRELAGHYCRARSVIVCWAMGLTQHPNGVANIQQIVNLLLLGGHFGRPGSGVCPVRGHSNVQGDRTVGIDHRPPAWIDRLEQRFGFQAPRGHGLDTVDTIRAMLDGRVSVLFALGGNFLSATPDTDKVAEGLANCALTVQVSTKLNRSHLVTGREALILPCLGRSEGDWQESGWQFVTTENSMCQISRSQGRLEPASAQLKSEVAIICELAQAVLGPDSGIDWRGRAADYSRIRDDIAAVVPGFDHYQQRAANGGFILWHPVRDEGIFPTDDGRAHFTVHELPAALAGDYRLMTIRSHDQYNTTIYGLDDRYRGIRDGRRVLMMNAEDMRAAGLAEGQWVDVVSRFPDRPRRAPAFRVTAYDIPRGCVAAYYPETNVLVALDHFDSRSQTPASKLIPVTLHPSSTADDG